MLNAVFWAAAALILVIIEILTTNLVTIWFASGSLVAMILAMFHIPLFWQVIAFLVASTIALYLWRPWTLKHFHPQETATVVGRVCKADDNISALDPGHVTIGDVTWRACSKTGELITSGTIVRVDRIEGTKLIVERVKE